MVPTAMLLLECDFRAEDIQIIGADCVDSSTGIIARTWFSLSFLRILYVSKLFDDIEQCHRSGWASRSIAWQVRCDLNRTTDYTDNLNIAREVCSQSLCRSFRLELLCLCPGAVG